MTRVEEEQRKRVKAPKVKTGCTTCKIRRIKCDETKPECMKCTSSGRKCDGFPYRQSPLRRGPSNPVAILPQPTTAIWKDQNELRSFHFFQEKTLGQLAGPCRDDFWLKLVLQTAHTEPSINHAVFALSGFHEAYVNLSLTAKRHEPPFALQQYNLAIKNLVDPSSQGGGPIAHLLSCLIFFSIEVLRGNFELAIQLYHSGQKVLRSLRDTTWQSPGLHDCYLALQAVFIRLEIQIVGVFPDLAGDQGAGLLEHSPKHCSGIPFPAALDRSFVSSQVKETLERLTHRMLRSYYYPDPELGEFNRQFIQGSDYLHSLLELRKKSFDQSERRAACVLKLQLAQMVFIDALRDAVPTPHFDHPLWDTRVQDFRELVDIAIEAVEIGHETGHGCPSFSLDSGVIGPMFFVVSHCRDPIVRRKAIAVVKSSKCIDAVWNSDLTARAMEAVLRIEEDGIGEVKCAEDIPRSNRISVMKLEMHKGSRTATLCFKRNEVWLHEELRWE